MNRITDNVIRAHYVKQLSKVLPFAYIDGEARDTLATQMDFLSYNNGETILREGEVSSYLFAVLDGNVHVSLQGEQNKEIHICTLGAFELFGEAGIFLNVRRTASVVAGENVVVASLPRDGFVSFAKSKPRSANVVLMIIVHSLLVRLRETNQELAFERKSNMEQEDIDQIVSEFIDNDPKNE